MADIFDKMVAGISKGVASVGTSSKAMIEKAKINSIIRNLEQEKKQLAELLGMKVYTAFIEDREIVREEIESFCNELTKRERLIAEQKEQLAKIEMEVRMVTGESRSYTTTCICGNVNV